MTTEVDDPDVQTVESAGTGSKLSSEVRTVREILELGLVIPDYQRPYKWQVGNVADLIDDIASFRRFGQYRVGTLVIHQDQHGVRNIVDGQQRFITFSLIAHYLSTQAEQDAPDVADVQVPDLGAAISSANMIANYAYIQEALAEATDLEQWAEFFLDNCELVVLTVTNVDEAFQMFDSQNTRGRALYPTDLLKAFHIREMDAGQTTNELRRSMVRMWEDIPPESINELFSDYLFKIKRWANGQPVPSQGFAAEHVDLFKGVAEGDPLNAQNGWALPYLYAKNYTDDFVQENSTIIRYGAMSPISYPFQIDQPVLNGETFFYLVKHYYELGLRCGLFRDDEASESAPIMPELQDTLTRLNEHSGKATHRLVRNLFDCLMLYYVDRFGNQEVRRASRMIVRFAMIPRVQQIQVRRDMINNYALGTPSGQLPTLPLFQDLRQVLRAKDFLRIPMPTEVKLPRYPELHHFFKTPSKETS